MMKNKIKTILLLSLLSGMLMMIGLIFGGSNGLKLALLTSLIMNYIAYFYSDKIVLHLYKAQPLDPSQYSSIYRIVTALCSKMHIPVPKLWLIDSHMANAFATGRNPQNASVAVTTGILEILNEDELKAVLSHEISHIQNRDILITSIAAALATAIGYLASIMQYSALFDSNNERRRMNPLGLFLIAILMPIAATLIQLSISRSREYLADETGAHCCGDPLALASALEKLQHSIKHKHLQKEDVLRASTASLFIVHPFTSTDWISLFSTHPPLHKRIARLKLINEEMKNK